LERAPLEQETDQTKNIASTREQLVAAFGRSLPPEFARDAKVEASMEMAADFLLSHATTPFSDTALILERANALEPTARSFVQEFFGFGLLFLQLAELSQRSPPSTGY
jgi:hypothetical protein